MDPFQIKLRKKTHIHRHIIYLKRAKIRRVLRAYLSAATSSLATVSTRFARAEIVSVEPDHVPSMPTSIVPVGYSIILAV